MRVVIPPPSRGLLSVYSRIKLENALLKLGVGIPLTTNHLVCLRRPPPRCRWTAMITSPTPAQTVVNAGSCSPAGAHYEDCASPKSDFNASQTISSQFQPPPQSDAKPAILQQPGLPYRDAVRLPFVNSGEKVGCVCNSWYGYGCHTFQQENSEMC